MEWWLTDFWSWIDDLCVCESFLMLLHLRYDDDGQFENAETPKVSIVGQKWYWVLVIRINDVPLTEVSLCWTLILEATWMLSVTELYENTESAVLLKSHFKSQTPLETNFINIQLNRMEFRWTVHSLWCKPTKLYSFVGAFETDISENFVCEWKIIAVSLFLSRHL